MDQLLSPHTRELMPQLAAFEAVAITGHVTKGADLLDVPQSSVSRRLKALEKTLGFPLFAPSGRRVVLTPAGRELYVRIRGPLHALDDAIETAAEDADPDGGLVRFGFPLSLGASIVPELLSGFRQRAPRVRLSLRQAHAAELIHGLTHGELDLAIVIPPPVELPSLPLGRQSLRLNVSRGHRLAGAREVDLAALADETFIANPQSFNLRQLFERWCNEAGFSPTIALEIAEFDTMRELVARDLGIAVLPAAGSAPADLVEVPLRAAYTRDISLTAMPGRMSPAAARLHDHLRRSAHLL